MIETIFLAILVVSSIIPSETQIIDFKFLDELHLDVFDKPFDWILFDFIPKVLNQKSSLSLETKEVWKEYIVNDESNDEASHLSTQELITRSGFDYESYEAIADDGYVTQITRLINPLANRRFLRKPPVLMEHGGTIDPSAYIMASSIQHHPEKWPRTVRDGPITSWNRSLAFVLANNGFDVWLAETRGSSDKNRKYIPSRAVKSVVEGRNRLKNLTLGEQVKETTRHTKWDYWDFSQDDIIAHEFKSHIDLVLEKTDSERLLMLTFSLSTPTGFGFFSLRPDYAKKVDGMVVMAPIISGEHVDRAVKFIFDYLCPNVPQSVGTIFLEDILFTQRARDLLLSFSASKWWRYSIYKAFNNYIFGASAKYQTLIDQNAIGHLLRSLSFKEAQQLCQQMKTNTLAKYDYGRKRNLLIYGNENPPVYNLTEFHVKDWIVVSAQNDGLSTQAGYGHLMREVFPKPKMTILAEGFNHFDLIAAFENDKYVNLPILKYFQSRSTVAAIGHFHTISHDESARQLSMDNANQHGALQRKTNRRLSTRQIDMKSFMIPGLENFVPSSSDELPLKMPETLGSVVDTIRTLQRALSKSINLNRRQETPAERLQLNMQKVLRGLEKSLGFENLKESSYDLFD